MGAHVSATNRTGYETKCRVAKWGTFGLELDPTRLSDEEKNIICRQIEEYHKDYELINRGDLYRLISPFDNPYRAAWQFVSSDKSQAMVTLVTMRWECHQHLIIRLRGLEPEAYYKDTETGKVFSGAMLMNAGIVFTDIAQGTGESAVIHIEKVL